jgi:hypothetical protein
MLPALDFCKDRMTVQSLVMFLNPSAGPLIVSPPIRDLQHSERPKDGKGTYRRASSLAHNKF